MTRRENRLDIIFKKEEKKTGETQQTHTQSQQSHAFYPGKARYSKQFENPLVSNDAIIPLMVQIHQRKQRVYNALGVQLSLPIQEE